VTASDGDEARPIFGAAASGFGHGSNREKPSYGSWLFARMTIWGSAQRTSTADITVFARLAFADFAKSGIPAECKNLHAWRAKVAKRPSIAG
jgi:glutathione S-transferase